MQIKLQRQVLVTSILAVGITSAAWADPLRTASGSFNGHSWTAQSMIVGVNSTGGVNGGGDPTYFGTAPQYSGVVALILTYTGVGSFICTGTLLPDRQSILTAGHCVTNGPTLATPDSATAYFYGGTDADQRYNGGAFTQVAAASFAVNPGYTGQVIDQNDIAVIRLAAPAPAFAQSYGLYTGELTGTEFNAVGFGGRSSIGGSAGTNSRTGYRRQGDNRYDFRFGDADWAGIWNGEFDDPALPSAQIDYSFVSDFDNGLAANDASGLLAASEGLSGPKYNNLGLGVREVGVAGGDSGGPQFVGNQISSVTSYGLSFGASIGDFGGGLNSGFGEFSGYVPVSIHAAFINAQMVPEPSTYGMMALGLLGIGWAARRRRPV